MAQSAYEAADANVAICKATIEQNKAALELAETNLAYTVIRSPVDGMIIDRKVDSGQTVAAQFQTPELFKVAPDMEKRMFVYASVDEADIGLIREAQRRGQPVLFTVDAYPERSFSWQSSSSAAEPDDHAERGDVSRDRRGSECRVEVAAWHDRRHFVSNRQA